jgi:hypothetical protein
MLRRLPYGQPGTYATWQMHAAAAMAAQVSGVGSDTASPLLTDLAAYWKLDDLTWSDSVGSNDLTNNGGVVLGMPKLGAGSAEFDGSNYLSATSTSDLQSSTAFTIACWIKPSTLVGSRGIVFKGGSSSSSTIEYLLAIIGGDVRFFVNTDASSALVSGITTTEWWSIVAYYDGQPNIRMQSESGTLLTDTGPTITQSPTTKPFEIGRYWGANFYDGLIDEIGIWKRLLTLSEISDLYNSGSGLSYPFS